VDLNDTGNATGVGVGAGIGGLLALMGMYKVYTVRKINLEKKELSKPPEKKIKNPMNLIIRQVDVQYRSRSRSASLDSLQPQSPRVYVARPNTP